MGEYSGTAARLGLHRVGAAHVDIDFLEAKFRDGLGQGVEFLDIAYDNLGYQVVRMFRLQIAEILGADFAFF